MTAAAAHLDAAPRAVTRPSCPVCAATPGGTFLTREEVAAELRARDRFFAARLDSRFSRRPVRDLTDVVLGTPAAILRCVPCGVLIRDVVPDDDVFRLDRYEDGELASLHDAHARAFAAKEMDYRSLLPRGARVVEVGSYVGGFLTAAARWDWRATGLDIGRDPVRFCRRLGLDVQCFPFEESRLAAESLDAVFIWNCFEQVIRPVELLAEVHRVLRSAGVLVIRVPDADAYIRGRDQLAVLAYNGLLGWPHRFGYDAPMVRRLVQKCGFAFIRTLRRPAVRPLREAMLPPAQEEEARTMGNADYGWIELTFRKY